MRLLTILFLFASPQLFSQADTVYKFFNKNWKPVQKDSAYFTAKIIKENSNWHRWDFWTSTNIMQMNGYYEDAETEIENGSLKFFNEQGILRDSSNYEHGKLMSKYSFYETHSIKGFVSYNNTGQVIKQAGYTEDGKEIPGYIFQKEAAFPGGIEAWQKYLVKGLTTKQPKAYIQGKISGTVVISFLVYKDGTVQEVEVANSSGYKELDDHAVTVIKKSPKWIPAVQYNQPVIYRQKQSLVYAPQ